MTTLRAIAERLRAHAVTVTTTTIPEWVAWNVTEQAICDDIVAAMLRLDPDAEVGRLVRSALERPERVPPYLCTLDAWAQPDARIEGLQRATTMLKANNVFQWIEQRERHQATAS